jgi:hypothetical protein
MADGSHGAEDSYLPASVTEEALTPYQDMNSVFASFIQLSASWSVLVISTLTAISPTPIRYRSGYQPFAFFVYDALIASCPAPTICLSRSSSPVVL